MMLVFSFKICIMHLILLLNVKELSIFYKENVFLRNFWKLPFL